jgi:hypothetical protein
MNESVNYGDDERGFIEILKSMGISEFDPLVPVALNEYAKSTNCHALFI